MFYMYRWLLISISDHISETIESMKLIKIIIIHFLVHLLKVHKQSESYLG